MKIVVEVPASALIINMDENSASVLNTIANGVFANKDYKTDQYIPDKTQRISFQIIPDDVIDVLPERDQQYRDEIDLNKSRWLEEYHKRQAAETKIKELELKLGEIKI